MTITIKKDYQYKEEIKKSIFICHLKRISSEEEAREFIAAIKKEHYKANHNCSAFTLGDRQEIQRSSDDGEPSGTAGVPMLEILKKKEITNICAVVTRYFGGIKLGAGGLIRAYAGAVNHAVEEVGLVEFVQQKELILSLDYGLFDSLQRYLVEKSIAIFESNFAADVEVKIFVDLDDVANFTSELIEKFSGKLTIEEGSEQLIEVPFE